MTHRARVAERPDAVLAVDQQPPTLRLHRPCEGNTLIEVVSQHGADVWSRQMQEQHPVADQQRLIVAVLLAQIDHRAHAVLSGERSNSRGWKAAPRPPGRE